MDFDGASRAIISNAVALNPGDLTVEVRVKFDRLASHSDPRGKGAQFLLSKGGDNAVGTYRLQQYDGDQLSFDIGPCCLGENSATAHAEVPALSTDRWYHIAGTYDGNSLRLYLDGRKIAESEFGAVTVGNLSPLYLSYNDVPQWPYFLDGQIDWARIWSTSRTEAELVNGLHLPVAPNERGLVGAWDFSEPANSQLILDATTNGIHGHLGSTNGPDGDDPTRLPQAETPTRVTSLEPTTTGFVVRFSGDVNPTKINLYDTQASQMGPPDVTLMSTSGQPVVGSLMVDSKLQQVTFVKTGGPLSPDTYNVTLRSGINGFVDAQGGPLDGDANGNPGGDFVASFVVEGRPTDSLVLSIPDFVRGPGQEVSLPVNPGGGIPLSISNGSGVKSIDLQLSYDPTLLEITSATVADGMPEGSLVAVNDETAGLLILTFASPMALPKVLRPELFETATLELS